MLNIICDDTITLKDIKENIQSHKSVVRSAHIGNWNKQTICLSKLGINILLHESLNGNAKVYEPSYLRFNNQKYKLTYGDETQLQLFDNQFIYSDIFGYHKTSKYHYDFLKKMVVL